MRKISFLTKWPNLSIFFLLLDLLHLLHKKIPRSWNPTNITSQEGYNLFSNSTSPVKESKNHAEHCFLDQMAKSIKFFFVLWLQFHQSYKRAKKSYRTLVSGPNNQIDSIFSVLKWPRMTQNDPKNYQNLFLAKN